MMEKQKGVSQMKKQLLVMALALALVFCLSGPALAETTAEIDLTVTGNDSDHTYLDDKNFDGNETVNLTTAGDRRLDLDWDVSNGYTVKVNNREETDNCRVSLNKSGTTKIVVVVTNNENPNDQITVTLQVTLEKAQLTGMDVDSYEDEDERYLDAEDDFDEDKYSYSIELIDDESGLLIYPYWDDEDNLEVEVSVPSQYEKDVDIDEDDEEYLVFFDDAVPSEIYVTISGDGYEAGVYTLKLSASLPGKLTGLSVSEGKDYDEDDELDLLPKFDKDTASYAVLLPYDSDNRVSVRFEMDDRRDYLAVDGSEVNLNRDGVYDLEGLRVDEGERETIKFTAGGKDYTLTIIHAPKKADDDSSLDDLRLQRVRGTSSSAQNTALEMSPKFRSTTNQYAMEKPGSEKTLYLYAEPAEDEAVVFVNGVLMTDSYIELETKGLKQIDVQVYAEDLESTSKYTLYFGEVTGNSGQLTDLKLYDVSMNGITLSPVFNAANRNYTANVASNISSFYIYATAETGTAVAVSHNGGNYVNMTANATAYNLSDGLNVFEIRVTTSFNTVSYYNLNVYRQAARPTIVASGQQLSIDNGVGKAIAAYNINGNNFLKLRDVAYLLNGTAKSFSVGYSQATNRITLRTGAAYTPDGSELKIPGAYKNYTVSPQTIQLDSGFIYPAAYNIDGNNYFLLRDLALLFNFYVGYNNGTVTIDTTRAYSYSN